MASTKQNDDYYVSFASLSPILPSLLQTWYNGVGVANVTLISIAGGDSDVQVPPHLTITPSHSYTSLTPNHHPPITTLSIAGSAVPRNWVSADHQAVVWCRRLQLALGRAIFLIQTPPTQQLTSDPRQRGEIFRHLLFTGWKVPMQPDHTQSELTMTGFSAIAINLRTLS